MNELFKKALEELQEEGKIDYNLKITKEGKQEAEQILKSEPKCRNIMLNVFWKRLQGLFYELEPKEFVLKVLELEGLLKKANIDLEGELRSI